MKINISESIKKRLIGAKEGTKIKIHYFHSSGDLMVKCINDKHLEKLNQCIEINTLITKFESDINQLTDNRDNLIKELLN